MINQEGLDLIKKWEGFESQAYRDSVGVWTIGYGTTARAGVGIDPKPGMTITEEQAEEYLERTINKFYDNIKADITRPINENQLAAFLSLAYNIGPHAFRNSTALRRFNNGAPDKEVVEAMQWFNKAGDQTLRGLVRRRKDEAKLFMKPVEKDTLWQRIKRWLSRNLNL